VVIAVLLVVATKATKSDGRETVLVRRKQEEQKERDKKQNEEKRKLKVYCYKKLRRTCARGIEKVILERKYALLRRNLSTKL
jgi:hypothetical protein